MHCNLLTIYPPRCPRDMVAAVEVNAMRHLCGRADVLASRGPVQNLYAEPLRQCRDLLLGRRRHTRPPCFLHEPTGSPPRPKRQRGKSFINVNWWRQPVLPVCLFTFTGPHTPFILSVTTKFNSLSAYPAYVAPVVQPYWPGSAQLCLFLLRIGCTAIDK